MQQQQTQSSFQQQDQRRAEAEARGLMQQNMGGQSNQMAQPAANTADNVQSAPVGGQPQQQPQQQEDKPAETWGETFYNMGSKVVHAVTDYAQPESFGEKPITSDPDAGAHSDGVPLEGSEKTKGVPAAAF